MITMRAPIQHTYIQSCSNIIILTPPHTTTTTTTTTTGKKDIRILNDVLLCMNPENTGKCMYVCVCMCVSVCVVEDPMITRELGNSSYHLLMERI